MREKRGLPPVVGLSTLLTIFSVLCLTFFALLTLSTAQTEDRLSRRSADAVTGYYRADAQAQSILARLRAGEMPEGVTEMNGALVYACPISDSQALAVTVILGESDYTILRWQAVSTETWQAQTNLPVWTGS